MIIAIYDPCFYPDPNHAVWKRFSRVAYFDFMSPSCHTNFITVVSM